MEFARRHEKPGRGKRLRSVRGAAGLCMSLALAVVLLSASEALSGAITIAGNGPELRVVEQLTRAFEKKYLGTVAEIR